MRTPWLRLAFAGPRLAVTLVLALALTPAALPAADKSPKELPDLSGTWQINEDLSQSPRDAMRQGGGDHPHGGMGGGGGMGRRRGGGGGGRGGGFPGGGGPGGPGGAGNPEGTPGEGGDRGGPGGENGPDLKTMTLVWAAPHLTIRDAGGHERVVTADGRKVKEDRNGRTVQTRAWWTDGGSLEVETRMDNGVTRTEIYELTNDHRRLYVIVGVEGRGPRPIQFRRVYDRAEPTPASPPAATPAPAPTPAPPV